MSTSLTEWQTCFQSCRLGEAGARERLRTLLRERIGQDTDARLAIYLNAYRQRLVQALEEAFDKVHALVGDALFARLTDGYVTKHPSSFRNLRWYGDGFADFLAEAYPEHPVVAELARFEWTLGLAFDANDVPVLPLAALGELSAADWEQVGFALQDGLQCLRLEWNAPAIWLALDQSTTPPAPQRSAGWWMIWRRGLQPHFRSTSLREVTALQGLRDGDSFASVCAGGMATADTAEISTEVAGWLKNWTDEELLSAVRGIT